MILKQLEEKEPLHQIAGGLAAHGKGGLTVLIPLIQKEVGRIVHIYPRRGTGIPTEPINTLARPTLYGLRETSLLKFCFLT